MTEDQKIEPPAYMRLARASAETEQAAIEPVDVFDEQLPAPVPTAETDLVAEPTSKGLGPAGWIAIAAVVVVGGVLLYKPITKALKGKS